MRSVLHAFTAVGLSLVNVIISACLSSHGRLEQWRRDEEWSIVARVLTLSADALSAWNQGEAAEHWGTGSELYDKLCFELPSSIQSPDVLFVTSLSRSSGSTRVCVARSNLSAVRTTGMSCLLDRITR
jgi:hypothetical protein